MNHSAADAEALRDVGLTQAVIEQVFEQHEGVPSEHDGQLRLRRDVECDEGQCITRASGARALRNGCSPSVQISPVLLSKITPVLTGMTEVESLAL